jgi:23S rRNA (adenine2503-C2)-methyltransferase
MATVLDIAKHDPHAAPLSRSEDSPAAALPERDGTGLAPIEKTAEFVAASAAQPSLVGLTRDELKDRLAAIGVPERELKMRVGQLWHWIYLRGARSFDEMTNVGKGLRQTLAEAYTLGRPEVVSEQVSKDGTRKWLIRMPATGPFDKGAEIECVYIPEVDRGTLCVSSQVGCTLTCSFCHTGTQRLVRNLTSAEIVAQLVVARDRIGDWTGRTPPEGAQEKGFLPGEGSRFITNIVFMGMGEPLYNPDNVIAAIGVLSDNEGLGLSRRRITVSTSGVVPQMGRLGSEANTMLAISLHAVRDALRDVLVPLNRKYPIRDLLDACRAYPGLSNARRITFEYVMLKGVNDSDADARELVRLLKGIPAKINLIPFNPWPGSKYECSDWERIERFSEIVFRAGYASPVRTPRGRDILAACGQLKSETEKLRARARLMLESGIGAEGMYALGDSEA